MLAGVGGGSEGTASVTVPDWVDAAEPAVLEANCSTYAYESEVEDDIDYTPVTFDIEPGAGPVTQVRSFSRTSLLAGQALTIDGAGCASANPDGFAVSFLQAGTDMSGRADADETGAFALAELKADGSFSSLLAASNASAWASTSGGDGGPVDIQTGEDPNEIAPGPYVVFTYCVANDDSILMLEPGAIEITGTAPTDALDLTVGDGTRNVTFAGTGCTQGGVDAVLDGETADDVGGTIDDSLQRSSPELRHTLAAQKPGTRRFTVNDRPAGRGSRALAHDTTMTPDAHGAWATDQVASQADQIVSGFAVCGDPLSDGFFYDPQIVQVADVAPPVETTTTTTTPPPPAPANAVPGTPSYAG